MNGNQNNQQNQQNKPKSPEAVKRTNNVLIAIGVIILVIILALVAGKKRAAVEAPANNAMVSDQMDTLQTSGDVKEVDSSYQNALEAYIGRSVQFNVVNNVCTAFPTTQVFKVGTRVLLDNHGTEPVTVVFGAKTLNLKPFHYATLPLPEIGTFGFTCSDKNVATVTVVN